MDLGNEYLKVIQEIFKSVKGLGDKTIDQLSDEYLQQMLKRNRSN